MRRLLVTTGVSLMLLATTACGDRDRGGEPGDRDADAVASAAYTRICVEDATRLASTPDGYPTDFPLPRGTVLFHVEDRGDDGVVATGVTAMPFDHVLEAMNAARTSGFRVTSGETEEDDAEADWTGHGFVGRWAIKKSATCPGETVIQLLSKRG
jgi:hypothetical protein